MINIEGKNKDLVKKIAEKYNLRLLFLFGSRVTGRIHKESDYDFGYISNRELTLMEEGQFIIDLMPLAKARDERLINLVNFKRAKPLLLHAATNEAQLLYERLPGYFANLQARAFRMYVEIIPLIKMKAERMGIHWKQIKPDLPARDR